MCRIVSFLLLFCFVASVCPAHDPPPVTRGGGVSPAAAIVPLDLNAATAEQLDELPGIGPALAARIVAFRDEHGPFEQVEQLGEVKGIGARTMGKLRPYLFLQ